MLRISFTYILYNVVQVFKRLYDEVDKFFGINMLDYKLLRPLKVKWPEFQKKYSIFMFSIRMGFCEIFNDYGLELVPSR